MSVAAGNVQAFILARDRFLRGGLARILNKKNNIHVLVVSAFVADIAGAGADRLLADSAAFQLPKLSGVRGVCRDLRVESHHDRNGAKPRDFSCCCA
jgi:hypothetical protein